MNLHYLKLFEDLESDDDDEKKRTIIFKVANLDDDIL